MQASMKFSLPTSSPSSSPPKTVVPVKSPPSMNPPARPIRRRSILTATRRNSQTNNRRSSWDLNTDWDAMESLSRQHQHHLRRASVNSTCSQMSGSQSSVYHVLELECELFDEEEDDHVSDDHVNSNGSPMNTHEGLIAKTAAVVIEDEDDESVNLDDDLKFIDSHFGNSFIGNENSHALLFEINEENHYNRHHDDENMGDNNGNNNNKTTARRRNTTSLILPSLGSHHSTSGSMTASTTTTTTTITTTTTPVKRNSTTKVKRKSLHEIMMLDEESFSTSLASLSLSQPRSSVNLSSGGDVNHNNSSVRMFGSVGSILDHDFSSYFNDDDDD